jgi:hypothetical protein
MATKRSKVVALVTENNPGYTDARATRTPDAGDYWNIELDGQRFYVWQDGEYGTLNQLIELLEAIKKEEEKDA